MDFYIFRRTEVLAARLEDAKYDLVAAHAAAAKQRKSATRSKRGGRSEGRGDDVDVAAAADTLLKAADEVMSELYASAPLFLTKTMDGAIHDSLTETMIIAERLTQHYREDEKTEVEMQSDTLSAEHRCHRVLLESEVERDVTAVAEAANEATTWLVEGSGRGSFSSKYASEALGNATLVFCTTMSAGSMMMTTQGGNFSALIVDEAAQALEPELLVPFSRMPACSLLVGDPAQLPALMHSDSARRDGHGISLMQRLMDNHSLATSSTSSPQDASTSRRSGSGSWFTLLDTQYRMHPSISSFPSERFYGGKLRNARSIAVPMLGASGREPPSPTTTIAGEEEIEEEEEEGVHGENENQPELEGDDVELLEEAMSAEATLMSRAVARASGVPTWVKGPFTFVDVVSGMEQAGGAGSIGNSSEAELAAALAAFLPTVMPRPVSAGYSATTPSFEEGEVLPDDAGYALPANPSSAAVITFFSEQARRIRRELQSDEYAAAAGGCMSRQPRVPWVHTVDSFQGSEADVVVVSAVRSNPHATVGFLSDKRRLNVGLTRAKRLLVFLGCAETLSRSKSEELRSLVADAKRRGLMVHEEEARKWVAHAKNVSRDERL